MSGWWPILPQLDFVSVIPYDNSGLQQVSPKINTSAPKTGQTVYGSLLKSSEYNCFRLNCLAHPCRSLLILVALLCFDRYKIDYSPKFPDRFSPRIDRRLLLRFHASLLQKAPAAFVEASVHPAC